MHYNSDYSNYGAEFLKDYGSHDTHETSAIT